MPHAPRLRAAACLTAFGLTLATTTTTLTVGETPASAAITVVPVPTSNAGLGRITTAPDGSMWFVESKANKVGRITTAGRITEYTLPTQTVDDSNVMDLDIAADGTVWVVFDQGWQVVALNPNGSLKSGPYHDPGDNPDGGEVRVAPNGVPWITMNYADSGASRIVGGQWTWLANSPECDDVLGRANDGSMWCAQSFPGRLVRLNSTASGGTTYPLPTYSGYLSGDSGSIAAGPVGSIWFTRYDSGSFATPDGYGVVGYLNQATGGVTAWRTGSNTAPTSLVRGPDGNMWFTTVNEFHPGIGHLSAAGRGAISQVGAYQPTSLTFSRDGAIWFTDDADNEIVRVTRDQLAANSVNVGSGASYVSGSGVGVPPRGAATGTVLKPRRTIKIAHRKATFTLACPKTASRGCHGTLALRTAARRQVELGKRAYSIKAGKHGKVRVKLTRKGLKRLRPGRITKARVELTPRGGSRPTYTHKVKLRR